MAKRFTTVFFITLAIAVLCVAIFTLVLFMAPGMSVFGLKYIATNTHVVSEKFAISDALKEELGGANFSGSIRVEVEDGHRMESDTRFYETSDYGMCLRERFRLLNIAGIS